MRFLRAAVRLQGVAVKCQCRHAAAMAQLADPIMLGRHEVANRLYRAPVLEVAGNGPDASTILQRELEPAAAAGVGLVFQGACLVTAQGGRSAPGLSRVHDAAFVQSLRPAVEAVKQHGARLLMQLGHGALQTMEVWHEEYRRTHPRVETLAIAPPPRWLLAASASRVLHFDRVRVMTAEEIDDLADAFGRAAGHAAAAGYDGVHLAGANASIFQQCWSPAFNTRDDAYGGDTIEARSAFFLRVVRAIRHHTPNDFLLTAKIPAETEAPPFVRHHLRPEDTAEIGRVAAAVGLDAIAPVRVGVTRDQATARGAYPAIAWSDARWQAGYRAAFGGRLKVSAIKAANRAAALALPFEPAWNASLCRHVKQAVDIPILCEGGVRSRDEIDHLLGSAAADMVGMARPFYAEPRLPARLLHDERAAAICANCNNCTIPQLTGALGVCRTPAILARRGQLQKSGAYQSPNASPTHEP